MNLVAMGLEESKKELSNAMHQVESYCWDDWNWDDTIGDYVITQQCESYEYGLRDDLSDLQRDIARSAERFGSALPRELYPSKFLTDLIEAEYADFVDKFDKHTQEDIGRDIDRALEGL